MNFGDKKIISLIRNGKPISWKLGSVSGIGVDFCGGYLRIDDVVGIPANECIVEIDFMLKKSIDSTDNNRFSFCSRETWTRNVFTITSFWNGNNRLGFDVNGKCKDINNASQYFPPLQRKHIVANGITGTLDIDGLNIIDLGGSTEGNLLRPFYVNAWKDGNSAIEKHYDNVVMYLFRIIRNDKQIVNLVPAFYDNQVCMYDTVSKKYYYNQREDVQFKFI